MSGFEEVARVGAVVEGDITPLVRAYAEGEQRSEAFASKTSASVKRAEQAVERSAAASAKALERAGVAHSAAAVHAERAVDRVVASQRRVGVAAGEAASKQASSWRASSSAASQAASLVVSANQRVAASSGVVERAAAMQQAALTRAAAGAKSYADAASHAAAQARAANERTADSAERSAARVRAAQTRSAVPVAAAPVAAARMPGAGVAQMAVAGGGFAGAYGFVRAVSATVKAGATFEQVMSGVRAATNATEAQMQALEGSAISLGAKTAFSATEVGAAYVELGKAGMDAKMSLQAMPGILDAAAASGEGIAPVAKIASNTLAQFNMKATETTRIADVLAQASNMTQGSITSMGDALTYAGTGASQLGFDIEQTAAMISMMVKAGIDGSMAGTSTRMGLQRIAQGANASQKALKRLASVSPELAQIWKSTEPAPAKLRAMSAEFVRMDGEARTVAASLIFGTEASSGMLEVMKGGPAAIDKWTAAMRNSQGAAKDYAATLRDNLASDLEELQGALESAAINVYKAFQPQLREGTQRLQSYVNSDEFVADAKQVAGAVVRVGEAVADTTAFLYRHKDAIMVAAGAYATLKTATAIGGLVGTAGRGAARAGALMGIGRGAATAGAAAATTGAASTAVGGLGASMAALPVAPVAAGLAAVAGGAILVKRAAASARAEDERWSDAATRLTEAIGARQRAAENAIAADARLAGATRDAEAASERFGAKSPQHEAALKRQAAAARDAKAAHAEYGRAASRENRAGGSGVSPSKPTTAVSAGDRGAALAQQTRVETELTNAQLKRANASEKLRSVASQNATNTARYRREIEGLQEAYDRGDLSLREYGEQHERLSDKIKESDGRLKTAQREYDAASSKVNKLSKSQRDLSAAMGRTGSSIASAATPAITAFAGVGASVDDVKARIMGLARTKANMKVAREVLSEMTAAERAAAFGTSNINVILGKVGSTPPSGVWKQTFSEHLASAREDAAAGVSVQVRVNGAGQIESVARQLRGLSRLAGATGAMIPKALNPQEKATGGRVYGKGTGTSDDVPAMLSNGEWVIRHAAASKYGDAAMDAVNRGEAVIGYAKGGKVQKKAAPKAAAKPKAKAPAKPAAKPKAKAKIYPGDANKDGKVTPAEKAKYEAKVAKQAGKDKSAAVWAARDDTEALKSKIDTAEKNLAKWIRDQDEAKLNLASAKKYATSTANYVETLQAKYRAAKSGSDAKKDLGEKLYAAKKAAKDAKAEQSRLEGILREAGSKRATLARDIQGYNAQIAANAERDPVEEPEEKTAQQVADEAWQAKLDEWDAKRAEFDERLSIAERTEALDDDAQVLREWAQYEDAVAGEADRYDTAGMDQRGATAVRAAETAARRAAKDMRDRADEPARQAASELMQAQLEQVQRQRDIEAERARLSEASLSVMSGPGDIGYAGGSNAFYSAAGGGSQGGTTIIQTLHPGDPRTLNAISSASNAGNSTGGSADKLYSGRIAVL